MPVHRTAWMTPVMIRAVSVVQAMMAAACQIRIRALPTPEAASMVAVKWVGRSRGPSRLTPGRRSARRRAGTSRGGRRFGCRPPRPARSSGRSRHPPARRPYGRPRPVPLTMALRAPELSRRAWPRRRIAGHRGDGGDDRVDSADDADRGAAFALDEGDSAGDGDESGWTRLGHLPEEVLEGSQGQWCAPRLWTLGVPVLTPVHRSRALPEKCLAVPACRGLRTPHP